MWQIARMAYADLEHPRTQAVFGDAKQLSITQFARKLGIDPATAWRWKQHGSRGYKLPTERIGGRVIILRTEFDRWHKQINVDADSTVAA